MNTILITTLISGDSVVAKVVNLTKIWISILVKRFFDIQSSLIYHEAFMSFILKVIIIVVVTALCLFIGGWIASRIIHMENRPNLIDW